MNDEIVFQVLSNASIMNAVGCCGLQLYHFGETVSIPFWQDGWEPVSFCDKINKNLRKKLHTLCLLDIKVKEQSLENLLRGRKIFEPPRYMRVHQAAQQILSVLQRHNTGSSESSKGPGSDSEWLLTENTHCVGIVRVGTSSQCIMRGSLKELADSDMGEPLHSLIVCGECHPMEEEALTKLAAYYNGYQTEYCNSTGKRGVFHIVGLGLGQPDDVTLKGLDIIRKSSWVYLEGYTSVMAGGVEAMEALFCRKIIVADREMVEQNSEEILHSTQDGDVAFLVIGDPFSATTHTDLVVRALDKNIPINIVHNASILNAAGCCGLQLYSFGEMVSIPFWQDGWQPDSYYDKICSNLENGWHTLCLLDIKVKEQSVENMVKGQKIYDPPRFMTVSQAATQILNVIRNRAEEGRPTPLTPDQLVIGMARIGTRTQQLKACTLEEMAEINLGDPLHTLVIVGETHPMEDEYVDMYRS
nr:diphthine methyl ester synthase-like [Cherax quadricarinatus]